MSQQRATPAFQIAGEIIPPGERRNLAIAVSRQLTGLSTSLSLQILHGAQAGPCVFVSGAVHGDEINGLAIVQRLASQLDPRAMAGTLILAPAVNIFGLVAHDRYLPDRRDLNRSFPGSANGSLAGQLAHVFFENVVARSTLGIDLHTAAAHRYNLPQVRIAAGNSDLVELAMAFAAPVVVESPLRDGSMRQLADERGTPMLLFEGGEALRFDRLSIDIGTDGCKRVLAHIGMIAAGNAPAGVDTPVRARRSTWVRSPRGGITHPVRRSGDTVREGEVLATVSGLFGEDTREIATPIDGIVIGHATLPVVNQGDPIFHIARVADLDRAEKKEDSITQEASEGSSEPLLDEDELL